MEYETITKALSVLPKGEAIFSEMATTVELEDDATGLLYVAVTQDRGDGGNSKILITHIEWPQLRVAIDTMLALCVHKTATDEPDRHSSST